MSQDSWNPQQYEKFKVERSQPFYDLMNLLETPRSQVKIMDLGCGTGELTAELHHFMRADQTTGLDSSQQMLSKAQVFAENNLKFISGDINTWIPTEDYDIIFSNAALQWCSNHPALLARLKKALRARGQLAVQMPMNHDYPTHTIAAKMSSEEPWRSLLKEPFDNVSTMLTVEEYATLLFKLGFKRQRVFLNVYGHILESRDEVVEWVQGSLLTHIQRQLATADFLRFKTEYQQRLFAHLPGEKPFFYPFKRVFIWGCV